MKSFINRHAYALLIAGSLLDAGTTYYLISSGNGWELNPVMAFAFLHMGILPTLFFKMAITSEFGLAALSFESKALYRVAVVFVLVGLWNLGGITLSLII